MELKSFSPIDRVSHFIIKVMMEFEWHHVSLIVDETNFANKLVRSSLEKEMKISTSNGYPIRIDVQSFSFRNYDGDIVEKSIDFEKLLRASNRVARGSYTDWLCVKCRVKLHL